MVSPCGSKNDASYIPCGMKRKREEDNSGPLEKRARAEDPSDIFYDPWTLPVDLVGHILCNTRDWKEIASLRLVCKTWLKTFPAVEKAILTNPRTSPAIIHQIFEFVKNDVDCLPESLFKTFKEIPIRSLRLPYETLKEGTLEKISSHIKSCTKLILDGWNIPEYGEYSDQLILGVNSFTTLKELTIKQVEISEEVFKELSLLPMRKLIFRVCDLKDGHFDKLRELSNLEDLNIYGNDDITRAALAAIPTSVRRLHCGNNSFNDDDIKELKRLTNLEELNLHVNHNLTKASLEVIPESLTALDCSVCNFTSDDFKSLERLTLLTNLNVSGNPYFIEGVSFPDSLKVLDVSNCRLNDNSLKEFRGLTQLESLDICGNYGIIGDGFKYLPELLSLEGLKYDEYRTWSSTVSDWRRLKGDPQFVELCTIDDELLSQDEDLISSK